MKIRVLGVKNAVDDLQMIAQTEMQSIADDIQQIAVTKTLIKTGRARRNWDNRKSRQGFTIENKVPYIGRLEEGYSKQAPKGILQPTLRAIKRKYK